VPQRQSAHVSDIHDLGGGEAMAPNVETLLDRFEEVFVPFNLQIGMQAALHKNTCPAEVDRLLDLVEDNLLRQDVAFLMAHGTIERAEAAVFGTEVGVVDVPVDDVADYSFRMQLAANPIRLHADPNQVRAIEEIECLFSRDHMRLPILGCNEVRLPVDVLPEGPSERKKSGEALLFSPAQGVADESRNITVGKITRHAPSREFTVDDIVQVGQAEFVRSKQNPAELCLIERRMSGPGSEDHGQAG